MEFSFWFKRVWIITSLAAENLYFKWLEVLGEENAKWEIFKNVFIKEDFKYILK